MGSQMKDIGMSVTLLRDVNWTLKRVRSTGLIRIRISDTRPPGSYDIKGSDECILGKDSLVHLMCHVPSDLGSLILIRVISSERTLVSIRLSRKERHIMTHTCIKWARKAKEERKKEKSRYKTSLALIQLSAERLFPGLSGLISVFQHHPLLHSYGSHLPTTK